VVWHRKIVCWQNVWRFYSAKLPNEAKAQIRVDEIHYRKED